MVRYGCFNKATGKLKKKRAATLIIIVIIIASAVTLFGLIVFSALGAGKASFVLALLLGTGFGLLLAAITGCFQARSKYKSLFKSTLVEVPFRSAFTQVTYDGAHGIDQYASLVTIPYPLFAIP